MANNFVHGKLGVVSIGGAFFAAMQYEFTEFTSLDDITYSNSATGTTGVAFKTLLAGYNWITGTITFVYDTLNKPVLSTQDQVPGTLMSLILYPDGVGPYTFSAFSGQLRIGSGPKNGPVTCTTNFESSGTITRPSS